MNGLSVADQRITQQINSKLASRGVRSPCHVKVDIRNGEVTLSGSVQFAYQRGAAVGAASGVNGVRRIIDRLTVAPHVKR